MGKALIREVVYSRILERFYIRTAGMSYRQVKEETFREIIASWPELYVFRTIHNVFYCKEPPKNDKEKWQHLTN